MSSTENEKIAAEPNANQKPPVLDHPKNDKEDTQEREKMSVAHGFEGGRAKFLQYMLENLCWLIRPN
jgi:hypothetical protein